MNQNINKRKARAVKTVCELRFCLHMWLISEFFLCQDKNIPGSNCQKNVATCQRKKLGLIKHRIEGQNSLLWKWFFTILRGNPYTIKIPFKYYRADQLCGACVVWLFYWVPNGVKRLQSSFWKHHESVLLLYCLLDDRLPSVFPLYLGVYIFHYAIERPISLLNWLEKSIILSTRYLSVAMSYLLWS